MPNIASLLKVEIARISRKEIKQATERLQSTVAQQRKEIATLKRQTLVLEKSIKRLSTPSRKVRGEVHALETAPETGVKFSATKLIKHRERLGLSPNEYGALMGVSGQSIKKWESGNVQPRARQLALLGPTLALGKRALQARQSGVITS